MSFNEWEMKVLGDLIEVNKSSLSRNTSFNEIEYYDTSSVTQNNFSNPTVLKIDDAPSRAKRLVKDKDIIYSTVRPIQRHFGILRDPKPNTVVSTGFAVITCIDIEPYFLYYYLSQNQMVELLNTIAESSTTTFPAFNPSLFETLEIKCPDIETQKKIANVLSSIDDKIENNLSTNQTLEEIACALFKEWFVNFNYPNAEGNLKHSEFGEIPESWSIGTLGDVLEIKYGKDHKHLENGHIPVYGSGGIMRYANKALYEKESILIPRKGTLSNLFFINKPFWSVDTMFYTKIKLQNGGKYLFHFLQTLNLASMNVGTAVPSLTTQILNRIPIPVPEIGVLTKYEEMVSSLFSKIQDNIEENENLNELRDSLLPKLMSGEIEMKN